MIALSIEKLFDKLLEEFNFQRVETFTDKSPDFSNADYINHEKQIIIELKIIEKDFFKYGGVIDRFQSLIYYPLIPTLGWKPGDPGLYTIAMPPKNRESKNDTFEEPLRRTLKKANRQIRETKERLLNGQGYGIVILAFVMETMLDIELLYAMVDQLTPEFSSITGFLVFSPYYAIIEADISAIHGVLHTAPDTIKDFLNKLGDFSWEYFYQAHLNGHFKL